MKKYLSIGCVAAALVGCANDRGGMSDRSIRETGSDSYDRSSTNNVQSTTNNVNTSGSTSDRSNGTSQDNQAPEKN